MSSPRPAPRRAVRLLPLGAVLALVSSCQTEVFGGKDTYADPIQSRDYAQEKIDAGPRKGDVWGPNQRNPGDDAVASFADAVLALQPKPASVACLPLVSHDLKAGKPWVSELGVATADSVARVLREKGYSGQVYATEDVGLALNRANVARGSLTTIDAIAANGDRLGADVVVFGTFRRRDQVGALDRDVIACELTAYDVAGRRIATSTRWELASDDSSLRRVWDLAQRESSWMPDSRWGMPSVSPDLATELSRVQEDLAIALGRTVDPAKIQGAIYVAPLDVTAFAPHVATLRSAQGAYATEVARRVDAARAANTAVDLSGTIVLGGTEYPTFQAAEDHLAQLAANFQATTAARFAQTFSAGLGDEIRARVQGAGKLVNDLAAVRPADRALIEGELAQGGVARSTASREALATAGVGLLVATRLEKVGDALQVRVDAYDLAQGAVVGDGRAGIPGSLFPEVERALSDKLTR